MTREHVKLTKEMLWESYVLTNLVYRSSDFKILYSNTKLHELFECTSEEDFYAFSEGNLLNLIAPKERDGIRNIIEQMRDSSIHEEHDVYYHIITKTGRILEVEDRGKAFTLEDGSMVVNCVLLLNAGPKALVTEVTDKLTGMLQQRSFYDCAEEMLSNIEQDGLLKDYYVAYTNIRHFKYYNLRYGMEAGDKLLKELATLLQEHHFGILCARFTGDNFVFISNNPDLDDAVRDVNEKFERRYGKTGMQFKVGVYRFQKKLHIEDACDMAKIACGSLRYQKDTLCIYNKALDERLEMESYVIQNIDRALKNKEIKIYYQPVVRTVNNMLCGIEALVRWQLPDGKLLMPNDFIPTLEKNHLITRLDVYVVEEVCRLMREKYDLGYINVPVAVNLSRLDFYACDIVEIIEEVIRKYGLSRDMLNLEITESMVMSDPEIFTHEIKRMREFGYKVLLDDFGSAYSSLNVLRNFDLDEIKLDILFLRNFDEKSRQVVRSIVSMAKELKIHVLAEGVETQEQYDFLRSIGCEKVQGYLFSKPIPKDAFVALYQGREDQIETRQWHRFYEAVGKVNFITDKALSIVEFDGQFYSHIYVNDVYREVMQSFSVNDTAALHEILNSKGSNLSAKYHGFMSGIQLDEEFAETEYIINNQYIKLKARLLADEQGHRLYQGEIFNLTHSNEPIVTATMENTFRLMYGMYDAVYTMDLEKRTSDVLVAGAVGSFFQSAANENIIDANDFADHVIQVEDRKDFLEFFNFTDMETRIRHAKHIYLTKIFRTRAENGAYVWALHTIQRVPGTRQIIYSIRYVPRLYEQFAKKLNHSIAVTADEKLFQTLLDSRNVCLFWKDTQRRFVGANSKFLETFGFNSVDEIIGRTDEDMKWNLDDELFRNDELRVLREGAVVSHVLRKCLIKGVYRNIIVSKEPIYVNEKMVGLLGTFIDSEDLNDAAVNDKIDDLTGLGSVGALTDLIAEHCEAWAVEHTNFGMITMSFASYRKTALTYGSDVLHKIVREIGRTILDKWGKMVQGVRIYAAEFVFFLRYTDKNEVQSLSDAMQQYFKELRTMAGYSVTFEVNTHAYCTENFSDAFEMADAALGDFKIGSYIGGRLDQKRSLDILSRIPAAIAVFSVEENYEIKRLYLSEQAKYYSHVAKSGDSKLSDLVSIVHPLDRNYVYNTVHKVAVERIPADMEFRCLPQNGVVYWNRLVLLPYEQADGSCLLYGVYTDITDLKNKTEELQVKLETDGLTGLLNRHALREDFERLMGTKLSVAMLDIDDFKHVNDRYGHAVGDTVLKICADTLKKLPVSYYCYRYGGDEFLVVAPLAQEDELRGQLQQLLDGLQDQKFAENIPPIAMSYGVAGAEAHTLDELRAVLRRADYLLYQQKEVRKAKKLALTWDQSLEKEKHEQYTYADLVAKYADSDEFIYVVDVETYDLVYLSKGFCKMYASFCNSDQKYDMEFFRGRKCYEVLQGSAMPCAMCNNKRLNYETVNEWDYLNPRNKKYLHLVDKLIKVDGRTCRLENIRFEGRVGVADGFAILNEALHVSMYEKESDASIAIILEYLGSYTGASRAHIGELDVDGCINNSYEWCDYGIRPMKEFRQRLNGKELPFWNDAVSKGDPVIVPDIETLRKEYPAWYDEFKKAGIQRAIIYPLYQEAKIHGFFALENPEQEYIEMFIPVLKVMVHFIESLMISRDLLKSVRSLVRRER